MLSPLSRGYGTWTGNYDPYNEEGVVSFNKIFNFANQEYKYLNISTNSSTIFYF